METAGSKKIEQILEKTGREWGQYMISKFEDSVEQRKLVREGELEDSFEFDVTERDGGIVISLKYNYYGNILTRSRVFWLKPANGYAIQKWVSKVGVDYFDYVPGYEKRGWVSDSDKWGVDNQKAVERIASAISFQRANGSERVEHGKMKARNWKRKPFGIGKGYLGHLMAERIAEHVKKSMVEALTKG